MLGEAVGGRQAEVVRAVELEKEELEVLSKAFSASACSGVSGRTPPPPGGTPFPPDFFLPDPEAVEVRKERSIRGKELTVGMAALENAAAAAAVEEEEEEEEMGGLGVVVGVRVKRASMPFSTSRDLTTTLPPAIFLRQARA